MNLFDALSLQALGSHLEFRDICSLIFVSKSISALVLNNSGEHLWESLCLRDFGYRNTITNVSFRQKYLGFRKWTISGDFVEETFEQLNEDPKQSISLFNGFGTGVLLHGKPFHVHPYNWSGSLVRCYTPDSTPIT